MNPHPPGYLSYGPLQLGRSRTCSGCGVEFTSKSGRGKHHWCSQCQGGAKHRQYKREYDRQWRKKHKR